MRQVKNFILIVLGVLIVIVMVQNAQPIQFHFLNWTYEVSQLLLVVIVLLFGFLAGFITGKMTGGSRSSERP
jgi:uncharacterized integral membrane protein